MVKEKPTVRKMRNLTTLELVFEWKVTTGTPQIFAQNQRGFRLHSRFLLFATFSIKNYMSYPSQGYCFSNQLGPSLKLSRQAQPFALYY